MNLWVPIFVLKVLRIGCRRKWGAEYSLYRGHPIKDLNLPKVHFNYQMTITRPHGPYEQSAPNIRTEINITIISVCLKFNKVHLC